jgi:TonB family protein
MSRLINLKIKKRKELNELQISVLLHIGLLILLSIYFAIFRVVPVKKEKKAVPIKLLAAIEKPKPGAAAEPKPQIAAKAAAGNVQKVVKPTPKPVVKAQAPVKKPTPTPVVKATPTSKPVITPKPAAKVVTEKKVVAKVVEQPKKPVQQPVVAVKKEAAQPIPAPAKIEVDPIAAVIPEHILKTLQPVVIQEETKVATVVRPSHMKPVFEQHTELAVARPMSTPMMDTAPTTLSISASTFMMPDSPFEKETAISMPEPVMLSKTGDEGSDANLGLFEIGNIEAFGGNNDSFSPPSVVRRVEPDYPQWAREKGVHGSAVYRVLILSSGTVGDAITMSSTIDPKLAITGAQALRRWVFTPVLVNGEPQETWVKISVQYELKS